MTKSQPKKFNKAIGKTLAKARSAADPPPDEGRRRKREALLAEIHAFAEAASQRSPEVD